MKTLVLADGHVGSTMAPWPRDAILEGGGTYNNNKFQKWLDLCWRDMLETLKKNPVDNLVMNGDMIQGVSHKDGQLVSGKADVQAEAAYLLYKPLLEYTNRLYMVRGTEWHEGKCAEHVEQLATALGAVKDKQTKQSTRFELYLDMNGKVIHFAHHISVSGLPWTASTAPTRDLNIFLLENFKNNGPNVKMIVRSHRHTSVYIPIGSEYHVLVTPCWQLKTAFGFKVAPNTLPDIGYATITESDDQFVVSRKLYRMRSIVVEKTEGK